MRNPFNRTFTRIGCFGVALLAAAGGYLYWSAWQRVPHLDVQDPLRPRPTLMTRHEYQGLIGSHPRPFVYEVSRAEHGGGAALVFGAEHTKDPEDPSLRVLRASWDGFAPTVLLVEGRMGVMFPAFHDAVRMFGESGKAHELAKEAGIPTHSWEPRPQRLAAALLDKGFSRRQVALRFILNSSFSNRRFGAPSRPGALVMDTLAERAAWAGAEEQFRGLEDVDAAWKLEFADGPDWREVSDEFGLPGFLGRMDLNVARDEHLVDLIGVLVRRGERVFVVCGCSHAVVVESAVRAVVATAHEAGSAAVPPG